MAHFTRVRTDLAAWSTSNPVDPAEFEQFDANLFAAINGDAGGTWAPSSLIQIGGSGISVSGPATFSSFIYATGSLLVSGTLGTTGAGQITGTWPGSPTFSGNPTFSGTPVFSATQTFSGTPTVSGTLTSSGGTITGTWAGSPTFSGNPTFSGSAVLAGTPTLSGIITCSSGGRIADDTYEVTTDGNVTLYVSNGTFFFLSAGTISATRTWTLSNTGATHGMTVTLYNNDPTYPVNVANTYPAVTQTIGGSYASGIRMSLICKYLSGIGWVRVGGYENP